MFATVLAQAVILVAAGGSSSASTGDSRLAVVVLTLAMVGVASLGCWSSPWSARRRRRAGIGAGVYLMLALLGGNFAGTVDPGAYSASCGCSRPTAGCSSGWDDTMRGGRLGGIVLPLVVPLAFAVAFFAVAVLRFRKRFA